MSHLFNNLKISHLKITAMFDNRFANQDILSFWVPLI